MTLKKKAIRGSALLTGSEAIVYGASFVRNMLLARLLAKADFGIAATFSMVVMLLEFSQRLGISRFVVRDKEGAQPEFIAAAHLVQFVAGTLSAVLLAAAAWPLSGLFGLQEQRWAMIALALIPLLRSVEHLDVRRFERELRFGPSALIEMVPQVIITLAAWPMAVWLKDYRAVLVLLIGKTVMSCLGSHYLSERPYELKLHPEYVKRMLRFGWPLVVNGFLMFGVLHGDQFLVASFYTMSELGSYAAAATLTMAPTFFFGKVFNSVMLPVMAGAQDSPAEFQRRYSQSLAVISLFSVVCVVGLSIGSEAIMRFVYGAKYVGSGILMTWLAAANAFRNLRIAPALAAIAKGDSENQMISNFWRVGALLPALFAALVHKPLWVIACTGIFGELLACTASFARLTRRDRIPFRVSAFPIACVAALTAAAVGLHFGLGSAISGPLSLVISGFSAAIAGLILVFLLPVLRAEVTTQWAAISRKGFRARLKEISLSLRPVRKATPSVPAPAPSLQTQR